MISQQALWERVHSQKQIIPSLYGDVDFGIIPERYTRDPSVESMLPHRWTRYRQDILADEERTDRALAYTLLGDVVADAYAALIPEYGFRRLTSMLETACTRGLEAVPEAPPQLAALIHEMEARPDWVDMALVNEGARHARIIMATVAPVTLRGAFIATFMNKYAGLPMALTGALTSESAVKRVKETASFFTTTPLPGALERYGVGFRAAAMVRVMHSMVRFNILRRSPHWNVETYGIPIPQIDQMPAGTIGSMINALTALRAGRKQFNRRERAIVEFNRYQCHLLGLPHDLLADTPQSIFDNMLTYGATLRDGYDIATNGRLVDATMDAYLPEDKGIYGRLYNRLEKAYSRVFFRHTFQVKPEKARQMNMVPDWSDYLIFGTGTVFLTSQIAAHSTLLRVPMAGEVADRLLVKRIKKLLVSYGHPEYTTDAASYRPATGSA